MRTLLLPALTAAALLTACEERGGLQSTGTGLGPALVAIDSTILQETADDFVSALAGFAVSGNGDTWVYDPPTGRVLHFDAGGALLGTVGHKGSGPGELQAVTALALDGDSLLHTLDWPNQRIVAFRTSSGEPVGQRSFPLRTWSMAADAGRIALGAVDVTRQATINLILPGSDSVHAIGPFPDIFARVPPASSAFGPSQVLFVGDTVVSAYEVTGHVYFTRTDGTILDSIDVPHVRRRGSRTDLFAKVTTDQATGMAAVYQSSQPTALGRIPPTRYALATLDPVVANRHWGGTVYISVIDRSARRSCVDATVPVPADPVPLVAFRGDTAFVLAQHVTADATTNTIVHRYRLDLANCDWLPEPAAN
ncbi:MAG TPA: hypothetical protein VFG84_07850 [Gemmatimonadaceae bacterium]|nr:hypothetical protein [Gemmatimonadaceae bacterium]